MTDTPNPTDRPSDTRAAQDPEEGHSVRGEDRPAETRTYQGDGGSAPGRDRKLDYAPDGDEPEIAADDAGASAMAERAGRQAED